MGHQRSAVAVAGPNPGGLSRFWHVSLGQALGHDQVRLGISDEVSTIPLGSGSPPSQKSGRKPYKLAKRTYGGAGTTMLTTTPP
jgi:hypothetical protein